MKNRVKQVFACLLSILIVVVGITPMTNSVVNAETTTGLQFTSIKIVDSETGTVVADLLNGQTPKLKSGVTYALNVSYSVPSNLQFSNTYLNVRLGDGVYIKILPGATFTEGPVSRKDADGNRHIALRLPGCRLRAIPKWGSQIQEQGFADQCIFGRRDMLCCR